MHTKEINLEVSNSLQVLETGGTLLYPCDTIWGIGCDATNPIAVERIFRLKRRSESKSLIILLDHFDKLANYITHVPSITYDLTNQVDEPLTIVYDGAKNLASNVIAADGTIAIRIIKHEFCQSLIRRFGKPIVSTSANLSTEPPPALFSQVSDSIKKGVNYIVNLQQSNINRTKPSKIIRLYSNGNYNIIRE
ncbi:MAG: L-threonylcarbamoyladenylate synthase [Lentimicrobiaceae bacterium]|jgi:L-threonylcarbamoyladenylate synthase|nr:L-threonylcarbamoyladenylate synthase [Lentimicrobiaceae bacterium]